MNTNTTRVITKSTRTRFTVGCLVAGFLGAAASPLAAGPAAAGHPDIERGSTQETFYDDLIVDLCGIETYTTLTERWSAKLYSDGSEQVHVVRTFVPEDPRLPIQKGAATTFVAPDGSRAVVGKPIHLITSAGTVLLDVGRVQFDDDGKVISMNGPHPSLGADLAEYYCPSR
jgi:hypothetical protein